MKQTENRLKNRVASLMENRLLMEMQAQLPVTKSAERVSKEPQPSTSTAELKNSSETETGMEWVLDTMNTITTDTDSISASTISIQQNIQTINEVHFSNLI